MNIKKKEQQKKDVSLMNLLGGKIMFDYEEVLTREVKDFAGGTSAHIIVPKKHVGRTAIISIKKKQEEEDKPKK